MNDEKKFEITPSWTERLAQGGDRVIRLLRKRAKWLKRQITREPQLLARRYNLKQQNRLRARLDAVKNMAQSQGISLFLQ